MGNRDPSKPDPQSTAGNLAGDATKPLQPNGTAAPVDDQPPFRVPPLTAIAGVLIHDWAHYKAVINGTKDAKTWKGSL